MSKKKGILSDQSKHKLAQELGFEDQITADGWQNVTSGQVGSMIKRAVQKAEEEIVNGEMIKKDH